MTNAALTHLWTQYGAVLLLGAGLAGVAALAGLLVWAKNTKKPLRPIALAVSMNLALLLNAEGMWVIATDAKGLDLPKLFAVLVFSVFEICFLTATSLAAEQYRRTTVLNADGSVKTPGHPGWMLYVAALIAGLSGVVVASFADSGTEKLLRLAVPAVIFLMWWAALTAAGQKRRRSRFAYSPMRIAQRRGWYEAHEDPDGDDLKERFERARHERQVLRMVVNHQRVKSGALFKSWWKSRLQKDARTASEGVVGEVVEQLARMERVMALLAPEGSEPQPRAPGEEILRIEQKPRRRPAPSVPQARAAREKALRVRRMALRRRVCSAHPVVKVRTVQEPRKESRSAHEKEFVVRAIQGADPAQSIRQIARKAVLPESTVRTLIPRIPAEKPAQRINGKKPELEEVNT